LISWRRHIEADVRDTEEILGEAAGTLDFSQPIALMMLGIMGQLPDSAGPSGPRSIVTTLLDALPPGSYLALSDGTDTSPALNHAIAAYNQNSASSYHLRSPEEIARFFNGLTLVPPGVVTTSRWRPDLADASAEPRGGRRDRRRGTQGLRDRTGRVARRPTGLRGRGR
jgi:hypothetical protein